MKPSLRLPAVIEDERHNIREVMRIRTFIDIKATCKKLLPAAIVLSCVLLGGCTGSTRPLSQGLASTQPGIVRGKPVFDALGRPIVSGVDNFGEVTPLLWRGGKPSQLGMINLQRRGVKTIIDLQEADESAEIPAGIDYIHLPVSQRHADQVDVPRVLLAIHKSRGPVFIHCLQGRDRTGLAIAAFRLSSGWTIKATCDELEKYNINFWWRGPIVFRIQQLAASDKKI